MFCAVLWDKYLTVRHLKVSFWTTSLKFSRKKGWNPGRRRTELYMGPGCEIATAGPKVFMPGQDPSFQEEWGGGVDPQVGSVDFFPSQLTLPCTTSWQAGNPNWLLHF